MARRPRRLHTDVHAMFLDAVRRLMETRCEVVRSVGDGRSLPDRLPRIRSAVGLVFLTIHKDADAFGYVMRSRIATDLLPAVRAGRQFLSQVIHLEASG